MVEWFMFLSGVWVVRMVYVLNWSLGGRVVYVFNWSLSGQSGLGF